MNSINIHDIDKVEVKTSEFKWGQAITIEVTATDGNHNHSVLGVISAYPAYLMNNQLENGIPVALKGRVPVKVGGTVKKGLFDSSSLVEFTVGCI